MELRIGEALNHSAKRRLQFTADIAVLACVFFFSYLLRFDFFIPSRIVPDVFVQLPLVILVQYLALSRFGVYSFIWRYIGLADLPAFFWSAVVSAIPLLLLRLSVPQSLSQLSIPLSVIVIDTMLAFCAVLGMRLLRRIVYERYERNRFQSSDHQPTLLVGAGRAGVLAAHEILNRNDMGMHIAGFVDDDKEKAGAVVHNVKVLGTTEDLPRLVNELGIQQVVITIAKASRKDMDRIVRMCSELNIKARIIPGLYEILGGRVEVSRIRDVQIEDLLGRETVHLDQEQLGTLITGKTVMVTGAGGSIGSELCRQVVNFAPGKVLLVERAEPALFRIDRELRASCPDLQIIPLLADVGDQQRMRSIFEGYQPSLVIHAAAHKHVPLMEANPFETIKNNVFGTKTLGELAGESGVDTFVFISTDKAVRPTSMMGASKRLAELVVQDMDRHYDCRYVAVRFGNVLGSDGSVIPIFRDQIKKGGPVTVTHPDMLRYFMTIPEAAQLVLQAGAMGEGGEIFILDMGAPVKIVDLARRMISLSGFKPDEDIRLEFTGMRPGEKLFEELETDGEHNTKTRHPKIFIGRIAGCSSDALDQGLNRIRGTCRSGDRSVLVQTLATLMPEAHLGLAGAHPPIPEQTTPPKTANVIPMVPKVVGA